jgi:PIN domain nuclease of toxin-antitoxin system
MDMLLDTHTFLWWLAGNAALSPTAKAAISDERNAVFVSAASAWEITTKHRSGKLPDVGAIVADLEGAIVNEGFSRLSVTVRHGQVAGALPGPHRDPFDRMLIAQAMVNSLVLVSNEQPFDVYGVARLW